MAGKGTKAAGGAVAQNASRADAPAAAPLPEAELIAHCRSRLAGFKSPKHVVFTELPKTSTGKIQKFELRAVAKLLS